MTQFFTSIYGYDNDECNFIKRNTHDIMVSIQYFDGIEILKGHVLILNHPLLSFAVPLWAKASV